MKSIPDLCRLLPDSEPEIRARADEFNRAIWLAVAKDMYTATQGTPDYLNSIADAKAATDTMIAKGCWLRIVCVGRGYECAITWVNQDGRIQTPDIILRASTEELARSAAALLASEAIK